MLKKVFYIWLNLPLISDPKLAKRTLLGTKAEKLLYQSDLFSNFDQGS